MLMLSYFWGNSCRIVLTYWGVFYLRIEHLTCTVYKLYYANKNSMLCTVYLRMRLKLVHVCEPQRKNLNRCQFLDLGNQHTQDFVFFLSKNRSSIKCKYAVFVGFCLKIWVFLCLFSNFVPRVSRLTAPWGELGLASGNTVSSLN